MNAGQIFVHNFPVDFAKRLLSSSSSSSLLFCPILIIRFLVALELHLPTCDRSSFDLLVCRCGAQQIFSFVRCMKMAISIHYTLCLRLSGSSFHLTVWTVRSLSRGKSATKHTRILSWRCVINYWQLFLVSITIFRDSTIFKWYTFIVSKCFTLIASKYDDMIE